MGDGIGAMKTEVSLCGRRNWGDEDGIGAMKTELKEDGIMEEIELKMKLMVLFGAK